MQVINEPRRIACGAPDLVVYPPTCPQKSTSVAVWHRIAVPWTYPLLDKPPELVVVSVLSHGQSTGSSAVCPRSSPYATIICRPALTKEMRPAHDEEERDPIRGSV